MKTILICLIIFFIIYDSLELNSASDDIDNNVQDSLIIRSDSIQANVLYMELWGNGIGATINYEHLIDTGNYFYDDTPSVIYLRGGLGGWWTNEHHYGIPIMVEVLTGKRSYFEFGVGIMLDMYFKSSGYDWAYGKTLVKGVMTFGYRYQPPDGSTVFKLGWTPVFFFHQRIPLLFKFGISYGFAW